MTGKDNENGEASTGEQKISMLPEILKLHTGNHPRMSLVSSLLDGRNYLPWSQSVRLALGAKQKLGFVDGTSEKPLGNKDKIEQRERVECMVISWLLNSISKEIVEAFLKVASTRDLWQELEAIFGEGNGPMLYEIQREIVSLTQGDEAQEIVG
ncbi:UNVERIFIED_CONTAM: hypothetical protein Sangu_0691100 [Sesamum angustifolium]|uniref:Retrotransposon Copia-like N-terminal domain-containing protein n=1 Tax=Sesamum angustifolium TaxID=2727405 RepID=A0AAW2PRK9_9LAMI